MDRHIKKVVCVVVAVVLGAVVFSVLCAKRKPLKPIAHYYVISNNSPVGIFRSGKFTSLAYGDYGKQHIPASGGQAVNSTNSRNEPFGWQQEYRDAALGLTYLRARYYQPDLKSFVTMDSYSLDNKYAYGYANPIGFIDPNGHMPGFANYLLNSFALITGMAMMIPSAGASSALSATAIAGAISVASGTAGLVAQGLSDLNLGEAGSVLESVSSGLAVAGIATDVAVGVGKVLNKMIEANAYRTLLTLTEKDWEKMDAKTRIYFENLNIKSLEKSVKVLKQNKPYETSNISMFVPGSQSYISLGSKISRDRIRLNTYRETLFPNGKLSDDEHTGCIKLVQKYEDLHQNLLEHVPVSDRESLVRNMEYSETSVW